VEDCHVAEIADIPELAGCGVDRALAGGVRLTAAFPGGWRSLRRCRPVPSAPETLMVRPLSTAISTLPGLADAGDLAVEDVHVADEVGHEAGVRRLVDFGGRRHLDDLAMAHHRDAVGHGHGLFLVVGDDDEGEAEALLQVHQLELGFLAQLLVEGAERLVEQQHLGALGQRTGERHALALAAGELVRLAGLRTFPA
jgi:hypothetical protein